ncbi:MAG: ParB/RepB/Spo0J family partition protein [Pseudomonadota bacterium]|uniref:Chromosome partitioning protein ParB n=1 Tax=Sphingobium xenophagum TaxID=121428 RepID=A0A249MRP7_SPHXE|nr:MULTISPECIES: ParB/RepB/Spo0J family partition protein [Sphingobium]ODT88853.1 MAG: chromosome partitioning protein ParB [Sphingobium sp. SCN 64-10]ASY44033.1 chromosome partitioning protein ParB [Sphingobium xenophagum]MBA4755751.1 ParB/RepB/Spo0J family partition protein [Sphingobium sp.]MBG6118308.1 ParB family chromosome partitioning protein [Sphingobium sp. JAI105]MBS87350.1 chromosome partitioning protein ParB [Sphingobium sp.]
MSDETSEKPKMAKRPHGLGRGLSALLGDVAREEPVAAVAPSPSGKAIQSIEVALIQPHPEQPRRHFDEGALQELAESIGKRGVIQPIIVRPHGGGFQIVAGERRWRAAQRAHLHRIPAIVRDFDEAETLEIALIENIQREDLNPIEEAEAYRKLIAEFSHSQEALGRLVGKSRSHVANLMRLLDLPATVQQQVVEQKISMGHARALIGAPDCEALARQVEQKGLSVRDTEQLVRRVKKGEDAPAARRGGGSGDKDADIAALEQHLADILGLKVDIDHASGAGGTLSLRYSTLDQLDMLCQRLSGERI